MLRVLPLLEIALDSTSPPSPSFAAAFFFTAAFSAAALFSSAAFSSAASIRRITSAVSSSSLSPLSGAALNAENAGRSRGRVVSVI